MVVSIEADPCHPGTASPSTGRDTLPGDDAFSSFVCKIRLSRVDLEPILNPPSPSIEHVWVNWYRTIKRGADRCCAN
jgi:hypothetical protein